MFFGNIAKESESSPVVSDNIRNEAIKPFVILPNGNRIFYGKHEEIDKVKPMHNDIFITDNNSIPGCHWAFGNKWEHVQGMYNSYDNLKGKNLCKGKECSHLQYKEECNGNSYVDFCLTAKKGNCIIVNDLRDKISELEEELDF